MKFKKPTTAVALQYNKSSMSAPKVTASGKGYLADKIVELAQEHNIPVQKNPPLAESLSILQIGEEIPPDLYEAVAQLLVYILHLDKMLGNLD